MVGPYRALRFVFVLALAALAAGCRGAGGTATLSDLRNLEQLQAPFDRDAGKPRIVLLLSPT